MRFMKNSSRFEPTMREELDALEQRGALVLGLVQHAPAEVEPGELAVEVELGRARSVIGGRVGDAGLGRRADGGAPSALGASSARSAARLRAEALRERARRRADARIVERRTSATLCTPE